MRYPPIGMLVAYRYNHRKWMDTMTVLQSSSILASLSQILTYDPTGQIIGQRRMDGLLTAVRASSFIVLPNRSPGSRLLHRCAS